MQERIKKIRKDMKLTQAEFGERISVKANTITGYETGLRTPSDAVITSMCREYHVNEEWLRTGGGDVYKKRSREEELMSFVGGIIDDESSFRKALLMVMSRMSIEEWEILESKAKELLEEMQK